MGQAVVKIKKGKEKLIRRLLWRAVKEGKIRGKGEFSVDPYGEPRLLLKGDKDFYKSVLEVLPKDLLRRREWETKAVKDFLGISEEEAKVVIAFAEKNHKWIGAIREKTGLSDEMIKESLESLKAKGIIRKNRGYWGLKKEFKKEILALLNGGRV